MQDGRVEVAVAGHVAAAAAGVDLADAAAAVDEHLVEAALAGPAVRLVAQVPLAEDAGPVAGRPEELGEGGGLGRQPLALADRVRHAVFELVPPGQERGPALKPEDYPTVESLTEVWKRVESYVREFLSGLTDEDLARQIEFTIGGLENRSMRLGQLMQHTMVHGVHHRGQVALLVRMLGYAPGNFDILFYYADKRAASAR